MDNVNEVDEQEILRKMEKRLNSLSLEDQLASTVCARHLANGACWGFDTDTPNSDARGYLRELEESGTKKIIPFKLKRGYVFDYVDFGKAVTFFRQVVGSEGFGQRAEAFARKRRESAIVNLQKFLQEGKGGTVGFYNTNSSDTITKNGKTFPSFCLNARDFFGILSQAGYYIRTAEGTVAPANKAYASLEGVMEQLEKSPSSNSVLIEIKKAS